MNGEVLWNGPQAITVESCQKLWLTVLVCSVNAALGHGVKLEGKDQQAAVDWLGTADFEAVCQLSGADPASVLTHVSHLWACGQPFEIEMF
jgi:hypothetical protein